MSSEKQSGALFFAGTIFAAGIVAATMYFTPEKQPYDGPKIKPCEIELMEQDNLEWIQARYGLPNMEIARLQEINGIPTTYLPFQTFDKDGNPTGVTSENFHCTQSAYDIIHGNAPTEQSVLPESIDEVSEQESTEKEISDVVEKNDEPFHCATVEAGDTLYSILANQLGLNYSNKLAATVVRLSGLKDVSTIFPGEKIICPASAKEEKYDVLGNEGKDVTLYLSYYDPGRGGINCNDDCTTTASGRKVLEIKDDEKNKVGQWWDPEEGTAWVACPSQFPFGTTFDVLVPGGDEIQFTCIDRGGAIIIRDNKKIVLDILYDDGFDCNDGKGSQCDRFGGPSAENGVRLSGNFKGAYNLPDTQKASE